MSKKGDEILLRARQQFRNLRTVETLRSIDVPEWGCTVYYWPKMSVDERRGIFSKLPIDTGRTAASLDDAFFAAVLYRARDELGERLFSDGDEAALADMDPDVIRRVGAEISSSSQLTIEDAEKN